MLREITDLKELEILIKNENRVIIIDFYATFCGPCKNIEPIFKKYSLNEELNKYFVFIKIDVEESEEISEKYNISAMPTFMAFKNGIKIKEFTGANPEKLKNLFIETLKNTSNN